MEIVSCFRQLFKDLQHYILIHKTKLLSISSLFLFWIYDTKKEDLVPQPIKAKLDFRHATPGDLQSIGCAYALTVKKTSKSSDGQKKFHLTRLP